MLRRKTLAVLFVFLGLAGHSCSGLDTSPDTSKPIDSTLVDTQQMPDFVANDEDGRGFWDSTKQVYTLRQFQPAWQTQDNGSRADAAVRVLEEAGSEGLDPEDFFATELRRLLDSSKSSNDVGLHNQFDTRLTYALVRYVSQLCFGRVNPQAVNPDWPAADIQCDPSKIVNDAIEGNAVENLATELSPKLPEYQGLKATLQRYRQAAAQEGQELPAERKTTSVARRLRLMGDLSSESDGSDGPNGSEASAPSGQALIEAVRHFQERHGLEPDGRVGKKTLDALNVPIAQRIEQIEINMDRMRWIAPKLEARHIRVYVPGFRLSVHDGDQIPLQMRAIVGSVQDPTPVLNGTLEYLVFSPYWNIPLSIATKEFFPKVQKDPAYLKRENIEVVRVLKDKVDVVDPSKIHWDKETDLSGYHLRQKPGATNALGLVKFIFPNPYNVYLHDTPSGNLFDKLTRTLSHGCIRVEKPEELAAYLLQDQPEWTPELIEQAMHAEKEKPVSLKTRMPVHLLYWTAWGDAEGKVQFREDVYGYDQKQRELTASKSALPAAYTPNIDVHKVGTRVVADATSFHRERGFSN